MWRKLNGFRDGRMGDLKSEIGIDVAWHGVFSARMLL